MYKIDWKNWESLNGCMNEIIRSLKSNNELELAKLVEDANSFFGNTTPGEYMGESWLVFKKILNKTENLPTGLIEVVRAKMKEIEEGFKAAGQTIE
jgi:hypothetical protein